MLQMKCPARETHQGDTPLKHGDWCKGCGTKTSRAPTEAGSTHWRNPPGPPLHLEEPQEPSTNWSYGSWKTKNGESRLNWNIDSKTLHWSQSTCHHVEDGHAAAHHGPRGEHAGQQNTAKDASISWENPKKPTVSQCCLLYTSPSPRDATLSRMPSSA